MPSPVETRTRRLGTIPLVVLAATAAFTGLSLVWSIVAPLGEAPDEPAHLALVLHLADGNPYPSYDGLENQAAIIRLCRTHASATRACPREGEPVTPTSMRRHPIGEAPDKGSRPAWDDEGGDRRVGQLNQMPQHPPLYYQLMGGILRAGRALHGGPWSLDRELALLRFANVLLVAPLPLLAWWAVRRFRGPDPAAIAASLVLLGIPMLTHIGSTLNNDNLLTLLGAVLAALLAGVARGDRSLRTAAAVGAVAGLALLTKAFAVVLPPAIVVAYLVGGAPAAWRERAKALLAPLAVAGATTFVLAGWWYIGVRIRTGRFAPTVENDRLTSALAPPGFSPEPATFAEEFLRNFNTRFWGSFGWYTIRIPTLLAALCTAVVLAALVAALVPRRWPDGATRPQRLSALTVTVLLGGFVAARAWSIYSTTSKFQFIQGRYLFAGIVGLALVVGLGAARGLGRRAPLVVLALAAALQLETLRRALQGWWGGPALGPRGQVRAMVAWSGLPGEVVALVTLLAAGAAVWLLAELVRDQRGEPATTVRGPEGDETGPVVSPAT